jgi:hypothetical protein
MSKKTSPPPAAHQDSLASIETESTEETQASVLGESNVSLHNRNGPERLDANGVSAPGDTITGADGLCLDVFVERMW